MFRARQSTASCEFASFSCASRPRAGLRPAAAPRKAGGALRSIPALCASERPSKRRCAGAARAMRRAWRWTVAARAIHWPRQEGRRRRAAAMTTASAEILRRPWARPRHHDDEAARRNGSGPCWKRAISPASYHAEAHEAEAGEAQVRRSIHLPLPRGACRSRGRRRKDDQGWPGCRGSTGARRKRKRRKGGGCKRLGGQGRGVINPGQAKAPLS